MLSGLFVMELAARDADSAGIDRCERVQDHGGNSSQKQQALLCLPFLCAPIDSISK